MTCIDQAISFFNSTTSVKLSGSCPQWPVLTSPRRPPHTHSVLMAPAPAPSAPHTCTTHTHNSAYNTALTSSTLTCSGPRRSSLSLSLLPSSPWWHLWPCLTSCDLCRLLYARLSNTICQQTLTKTILKFASQQ